MVQSGKMTEDKDNDPESENEGKPPAVLPPEPDLPSCAEECPDVAAVESTGPPRHEAGAFAIPGPAETGAAAADEDGSGRGDDGDALPRVEGYVLSDSVLSNPSDGPGTSQSGRNRRSGDDASVVILGQAVPDGDDSRQTGWRAWCEPFPCSIRRKFVCVLGALFCSAAIAVAATLAVLLSESNTDAEFGSIGGVFVDDGSNASIMKPCWFPSSERFSQLARQTLHESADEIAICDKSSPQYKALKWLADDDEMQVRLNDTESVVQRYSLAVFYFSTFGADMWLDRCHFLSSGHECGWNNNGADRKEWNASGVFCHESTGSVRALHFQQNNLRGTIPIELRSLTDTEEIIFDHNSLSGKVSPSLCSLRRLRLFRARNNTLTGPLPKEIGSLANLRALDLSYNKLSGSIPQSLGALSALHCISLYHNKMIGPLPTTIGLLSNLYEVDLGMNRLSGTIPQEVNLLSNLSYFGAERNFLNGTLPFLPGCHPDLIDLYLWENKFSGTLPSSLGAFTKATHLLLGDNRFVGTIPNDMAKNLTELEALMLWNNALTGTIPQSLGRLTNLLGVGLGHNLLTGTIPSNLAAPPEMMAISLEDNILRGGIPSTFGKREQTMLGISVRSNLLSGYIPSTIGNSTNLLILDLGDNGLVGEVPLSFKNLKKLEWFHIARTNISGSLEFFCGLNVSKARIIIADCEQPEVECSCCQPFCCHDRQPMAKCDIYLPSLSLVEESISRGYFDTLDKYYFCGREKNPYPVAL